jgi:hypothetical protein
MNYSISIFIFSILLISCSDNDVNEASPKSVQQKQNKKQVKKDATSYIAKKVIENKNKPLSKVIEGDGFLVENDQDKQLLDAFQTAVARTIINSGNDVPTCSELSETGYISKEDCEEISKKYFTFYELYAVDGSGNVDSKLSESSLESSYMKEEITVNVDSATENLIVEQQRAASTLNAISKQLEHYKSVKNQDFISSQPKSSGSNKKIEEVLNNSYENSYNDLTQSQASGQNSSSQRSASGASSSSGSSSNYSANNTSSESSRASDLKRAREALSIAKSNLSNAKSVLASLEDDLNENPDNEDLIRKIESQEDYISLLEQRVSSAEAELSQYE